MKSYVISLDRATHRREQFFRHARDKGWVVEVAPGVDKEGIRIEPLGPRRARVTHVSDPSISLNAVAGSWGSLSLKPGEYANLAAHLKLWDRLLASKEERICIFEDDAVICRDYGTIETPEDADFLFLNDTVRPMPPADVTTVEEYETWRCDHSFADLVPGCGLYAYIVTRKGAELGLRLFESVFWPSDLQLLAHAHGAIRAGSSLAMEPCRRMEVARVYVATRYYATHADNGFSYINS